MTLKAFSFGGGVQSMAALVLAAQGRIDYRTFVFSNVGDDSEYPATMKYLREIAIPFAEHHGLELKVLYREKKDGTRETLWGRMMAEGSKSLPIPVRFKKDGKPGMRTCTVDFKIHVISRWLKTQGATPEDPATTGIGISLDEMVRAKGNSGIAWQVLEYPLIELGLTRQDCAQLIRRAGLPVPPKSSCFFCPFHTLSVWRDLYDHEPELFAKSVELERTLNARRVSVGKDPVYLTRFAKPLDEVVTGAHQGQMLIAFPEETEQHNCAPFVCTVGFPAA